MKLEPPVKTCPEYPPHRPAVSFLLTPIEQDWMKWVKTLEEAMNWLEHWEARNAGYVNYETWIAAGKSYQGLRYMHRQCRDWAFPGQTEGASKELFELPDQA